MSVGGDVERLIVLLEARIDQFEKAMKSAESRGKATFQKLQDGSYKATTAIEKQMQDTAKSMGRSMESIFGAGAEWSSRAAMNADFKGFIQGKAAVDNLRAAMDPMFAASKRYESAVLDLDNALARGVISEKEHAVALEQAAAHYLRAGAAADGHGVAMGRLSMVSKEARGRLQNVGFQVQDMAVQMAAGTSATQALSQQLPQLLSGFGLVGIAAGTLAAVGLPVLSAVFGSTGDAASELDQKMSALHNSVQAMNDAAANYTAEGIDRIKEKYGELNAGVMALIESQRQLAEDQAIQNAKTAVEALANQYGILESNLVSTGRAGNAAVRDLASGLGISYDRALALARAMQDAAAATTFAGRAEALARVADLLQTSSARADDLTANVVQAWGEMQQLAASAPKTGWLAAAIGQAETLTSALWQAVKAKAAVQASGAGVDDGSVDSLPMSVYPDALVPPDSAFGGSSGGGGGGSGGGGGGGSAPDMSWLDNLISDLQTEREVIEGWYAESLASIGRATDAQLAAIGGRHEAIERLEAEHRARLADISEEADNSALGHAETFFGALATVTAAGGDRLVKAARVTAAAEAAINTYRAQAKVLADPTLGFWGSMAAYAAVGAAGMGLVTALGGSAKSAGGGSSAGGSSAGAAADPAKMNVTIQGLKPGDLYTGQQIIDLTDALMDEFGNRGLQLGFV